jgi:hypothetical protein
VAPPKRDGNVPLLPAVLSGLNGGQAATPARPPVVASSLGGGAGSPTPTPSSPDPGLTNYDANNVANDPTAIAGITDIYNLGPGVGQTLVPVVLASRGSFAPKTLPTGINPQIFAQANDVPAGGPVGAVSDSIQNLVRMWALYAYTKPGDYVQLQQDLYRGGFYGAKKPGDISWGAWGDETKTALVQALLGAAQLADAGVPMSYQDYIKDRADKAKQSAQSQPVVNQFTDPAAVVEQAKQAATQAIGRELTPDEAGKFAAYFHSQEQSYNVAANAAQQGQSVDYFRPDVGAEAQQYVEAHYGHEQGAQLGAEYVQALHQLVTGG